MAAHCRYRVYTTSAYDLIKLVMNRYGVLREVIIMTSLSAWSPLTVRMYYDSGEVTTSVSSTWEGSIIVSHIYHYSKWLFQYACGEEEWRTTARPRLPLLSPLLSLELESRHLRGPPEISCFDSNVYSLDPSVCRTVWSGYPMTSLQ